MLQPKVSVVLFISLLWRKNENNLAELDAVVKDKEVLHQNRYSEEGTESGSGDPTTSPSES